MELAAAGLSAQPFRTHGAPLSIVPYAAFRQALATLQSTLQSTRGLTLLQGPALSGKSTLVGAFVASLPGDYPVAVVDGRGLDTTRLLEAVLRQFGYSFEHSSPNELLGMVRVFSLQQTATLTAPLLIIENTESLTLGAFKAISDLAGLRVRGVPALKMVLVSEQSLAPIVEQRAMECLAERLEHDLHLRPMRCDETVRFLHEKLRAAGSDAPDFVFPEAVCRQLWRASGGWPGILDRLALLALAGADTLPVRAEQIQYPALPTGTWASAAEASAAAAAEPVAPPKLTLSLDGKLLQELDFDGDRLLIGRSDHNDIPVPSRFVSRHHALLIRHNGATYLMDLNSTNGTFVNSRRISNQVLMHDDVVTLGHHRLKFRDPASRQRRSLAGLAFTDTAVMKSLEDMRDLLSFENTATLPALTENPPTAGF